VQLVEGRALAEFPRERVLPCSRPHDQRLHGGECTAAVGVFTPLRRGS
jgi:hypothetical protein